MGKGGMTSLEIDSVWMVPLNAREENLGSRFAITEPYTLTLSKPFVPSNVGLLSFDRTKLREDDFGIWFIITSGQRQNFNSILQDVGVSALLGSATLLLGATPIPGDELVVGGLAATRISSVMGRLSALGKYLPAFVRNNAGGIAFAAREIGYEVAGNVITNAGENLFNAIGAVDEMAYFGDLYIIFPFQENYYANTRFEALTADGALKLEFTMFEGENPAVNQRKVAPTPCIADVTSGFVNSSKARTQVTTRLYRDSLQLDVSDSVVLPKGEEVRLVLSNCDEKNGVLWWRVITSKGEGWVQESEAGVTILEAIE
jgi:hypothetical protein